MNLTPHFTVQFLQPVYHPLTPYEVNRYGISALINPSVIAQHVQGSTRPTPSPFQSSTVLNPFNNQLHILNRMQQHPRQTHPPFPSNFLLFSPSIINPVTQPPPPQIRRKPSIVIPTSPSEVMFSIPKHACPTPATCSILAAIENSFQVLRRPVPINEHGMGRVDSFQPVMKSA